MGNGIVLLLRCNVLALAFLIAGSANTCQEEVCKEETEAEAVCLAVIARHEHSREISSRVKHILKHQHFNFVRTLLVIDSGDELPPTFVARVQKLVSKGFVDDWLQVNYSQEYVQEVNRTANFDPEEHPPMEGWKERRSSVAYREFNEDYEEEVQLAHYFAIDQCQERYLVMMDVEVLWMSQPKFSWVSAGLQLLRRNPGLVLVMPAFPGVQRRSIRPRPRTKVISKAYTALETDGVKAQDTTCQHPVSLAGWVSLIDLERYQKVGPRQAVREHRCGGQLVKGKRCKSLTDIRGCGGMRHWEYALECVICNRPDLRQAQLMQPELAWVQKAPITCFRSDMADMVDAMRAIENGSMIPVPGMDFSSELPG